MSIHALLLVVLLRGQYDGQGQAVHPQRGPHGEQQQLRLFGRAAGSHDVFDAIDRAPGLHGGKEADGSCSAICKSALTP